MKKVLLFVAALLTLTFTACENPADVPACYKVQITTNIPQVNQFITPVYVWTTENELKKSIDIYKDNPDYADFKKEFPSITFSASYTKSQESNKESCQAKNPNLNL